MTVGGIATQTSRSRHISWTLPAPARENVIPFACLMFFTFVLFISPQSFFPVLEPVRPAQMSAGIAALAYVLGCLVHRRPLTIVTPEVQLVSGFTLLALISIPLSRSPGGSFEYFLAPFLKSIIIFFLIANLLATLPRLKVLIAFLVLSGVIYSTTVLYNLATGHTMVSRSEAERAWGYPSPLALNPDDLGLILNVILSLTVGLYFATRKRAVKVLLLAVMGLTVVGIVVTFSRAAFLALAVTLAMLGVKWVRAGGPLALLTAFVLVIAGVIVGAVLAPAGYVDRLYSLVDWNRDRVGSIQQRSLMLQVASTSILENPLIGAGLGMEGLVYAEHGLGADWATHSIFLMVGSDLGIPGLLVYSLLFVQMLRGLRQTRRRLEAIPQAGEVVAIALGLELAVWSYLFTAAFLPVAYDYTGYYLAGTAAAVRALGARLMAARTP